MKRSQLKPTFRYYLGEYVRPVLIFYLVMVVLLAFTGFLAVNVNLGEETSYSSGTEMTTAIFLFVCGCVSFKEYFHYLLQNGVSRPTQFWGFTGAAATVCAFCAVVDQALMALLRMAEPFQGLYSMLFPHNPSGALAHMVAAILWCIPVYLLAFLGGYFVTTLYYRMNKLLKTVVSIGVPALLILLLPMADVWLFHGRLSRALASFMQFILGGGNGSPVQSGICFLLLACLPAGFAYLLMRRAPIK